MNELETLRAFFKAYEAVQVLPKTGRPGPERKAAQEELEMRATAVRQWKTPTISISTPQAIEDAASASVAQEFRALQQQVAAIAPKDTRGEPKKSTTNV